MSGLESGTPLSAVWEGTNQTLCDCWLANQTSVRRLRFRGQTHLLLKAFLFPTDITNVGLHSLLLDCSAFLYLSLFNTFSFGFHLFSCSLCYLPPWLISLFPILFLPLQSIQPPSPPLPSPQSSLHHYPAAPPT